MNAAIYLLLGARLKQADGAHPATEASLSSPKDADIFPAVACSPTRVYLYTISGGGRADLSCLFHSSRDSEAVEDVGKLP